MTDFETAIQHLGPSAKPLLSFLHKTEARNLLTTNMYLSTVVSVHGTRWGFAQAPYTEFPDGSFTVRTNRETVHQRKLKPWESLEFRKLPRLQGTNTHMVAIADGMTSYRVVKGTRDEIIAIAREYKPYKLARKNQLAAEAIEKAEAERLAKAAAEKTAYLAKYTIKVPSAPTVNPWTKK